MIAKYLQKGSVFANDTQKEMKKGPCNSTKLFQWMWLGRMSAVLNWLEWM